MYKHFNYFLEKAVFTIHPGEYYVAREDVIISTVLGSCVSVVLFDPSIPMGGMNHFMLPGQVNNSSRIFESTPGKYGLYAMELLINEMLKAGASRSRLKAKIFGGGSVLRTSSHQTESGPKNMIPENNVQFAKKFLETEGIPITATDTGGTEARKILLMPTTFRVLLKRYSRVSQTAEEQKRQESEYASKIRKDLAERKNGITLF